MNDRKPDITLASIVCIAKNYAIGKDNGMIWHLPEDLKHFKRTTLGKPIIMGRKSYDSLGKPLPGRPNLVISRSYDTPPDTQATGLFDHMESAADCSNSGTAPSPAIPEGPFLYKTIEDSIEAARNMALKMGVDEVFITGGGQIYKETLPYTDRLYLTVLDREYEADVYFPQFDWNEWDTKEEIKNEADAVKDLPAFTFYTLERKAA